MPDTFTLEKKCEKCDVPIPDDYGNLLCAEHYNKMVEDSIALTQAVVDVVTEPASLIEDPDYIENDEVEELDLVSRCHGRFKGIGEVMPVAQRNIYEAVSESLFEMAQAHPQWPKFIWNPNVADVGCGIGIGSNILSKSANFVWGIDKNEENIRFARQMFERTKNTRYWSPQVTFDVIDANDEPRELMRFDVITCIEVIEHLKDPEPLMKFLKRLAGKNCVTYISTPNRNAWQDQERAKKPMNDHHVREFTAPELLSFLQRHYKTVELLDQNLQPLPPDTTVTPVVVRCQ